MRWGQEAHPFRAPSGMGGFTGMTDRRTPAGLNQPTGAMPSGVGTGGWDPPDTPEKEFSLAQVPAPLRFVTAAHRSEPPSRAPNVAMPRNRARQADLQGSPSGRAIKRRETPAWLARQQGGGERAHSRIAAWGERAWV